MSTNTWHVDASLLHRYRSGSLGSSAEWAIEAHVSACVPCRAVAGGVAAERHGPELEASWQAVDRAIVSPRAGRIARAVGSVGVPHDVRRVLAATPALTFAWVAAVVLSLAAVVAATHLVPSPFADDGSGGLLWFLLVAPMLPASGIVIAFGSTADPVGEIALAAPVASGRLLLVRTLAVAGIALPLTGVAALFVSAAGLAPVAWLLPAVAVAATSVALSAVVVPARAVALAQAGWVVPVGLVEALGQQPLVAFGTPTQVVAAVAAVAAVVAAVSARDRYEVAT